MFALHCLSSADSAKLVSQRRRAPLLPSQLAEQSAGGLTSIGCGPARQVETGGDKPERIGRTAEYYGNDSLMAALESDSSLEVYGTDGTQDVPRKWEGFGEYKVVYRLRDEGLDYLGNDTVVRNYAHAREMQSAHARSYTSDSRALV